MEFQLISTSVIFPLSGACKCSHVQYACYFNTAKWSVLCNHAFTLTPGTHTITFPTSCCDASRHRARSCMCVCVCVCVGGRLCQADFIMGACMLINAHLKERVRGAQQAARSRLPVPTEVTPSISSLCRGCQTACAGQR